MLRKLLSLSLLVAVVSLAAGPARAIVGGRFDGNRHPNVGALVAEFDGEKGLLCSGTLIAPTVFLTAAHCIDGPDEELWVTFDPTFDAQSKLIPGTPHAHPAYGHDQADPHDIAVLVLDRSTNIAPAELPSRGLLDRLKDEGKLKDEFFTAVGYGIKRTSKTGGPHAFVDNTKRNYATQEYLSLRKSWLNLSMNPSTGSGGTCYGDSGGPHFLRDTSTVASITVTGDAMCRATDVTYRLDTRSARDFLERFVVVP